MILLTGATGTVGSALMAELATNEVRTRALAHSSAGRAAIENHGHEAVTGDLDDPEGLGTACEGCDQMFLLSPPHPDQAAREKAAIDSARRAGVSHVVALSIMGADPSSPSVFARSHADIDDHLAASGLEYTILRPAGFMQTHLWPVATIRSEGRWYGMTGDGAAAFIDASDVAAAAAAALVDPSSSRQVVELTGPAAITMPRAASDLADTIDRPVDYIDVPEARYKDALVGAGLPPWVADAIVALYRAIREGHAATVTDGVARLAGRPARSYLDFAEAHKNEI